MAIITAGNSLTRTEMQIDAATRDISLTLAGGLSPDGVTLQAMYSYLKKVWRVQDFTIGVTSGAAASTTLELDAAAGPGSEEILQGMTVIVASGSGVLLAGTEVASVSGTTVTLNQAIDTVFTGTDTVTFVNHLIEYPFPLVAITPEQFEFSFDWTPDSAATRKLIRTAGWREITTTGSILAEYVGVISLGTVDGKAVTNITATDISFSGANITSTAENFGVFTTGDTITVSGSGATPSNDGTYVVTNVTTDGAGGSADVLTVKDYISDTATSFTGETAGPSITIGGGDTVYYAFRPSLRKAGLVITNPATESIITGAPGDFDNFSNGDVIKISGTSGGTNDGEFTVQTASTNSLELVGTPLTPATENDVVTVRNINYGTTANFTYAGPVNEAIQTYDGTTDNRTDELSLFIREEGKTFGKSDTVSIGINSGGTVNYQVFRFPLAEVRDLDYTISDKDIEAADGAGEKYDVAAGNGPEINYLAADVSSATLYSGGTDLNTSRNFGATIDASNGTGAGSLTLNEIYSWVKYRLRRSTNIDDEGADSVSQIGLTSDEMLTFVGSTLQTLLIEHADGATVPAGVAIINFAAGDIGNLAFRYTGGGGTLETFPKIASGTITFNDNLIDDGQPSFTVYYEYTRQFSVTTLSVTGPVVGQSATIGDGGTNNMPTVTEGDYLDFSGFGNAGNNGVWKVDGSIVAGAAPNTTASFAATKLDDDTPNGAISIQAQTSGTNNFRFNPVNSPDAIIVTQATGSAELKGQDAADINSSGFIFDYRFTGDTTPSSANGEENRLPDTPVNTVIRAVGTDKAQWTSTPFVINEGNSNNIQVVAPLERNYAP